MRDDRGCLQDIRTNFLRGERFGVRPWIVWATGLLAYIVAVLDRTTLGVSGLAAADRFGASPSLLSTFVVLQVVVPAAARVHRIPAHGGRGAGSGRPGGRGDVHLRAPAGATLVLATAGSAGDAADRHLRATRPSALGCPVFRASRRRGLDHRLRVRRGHRRAVNGADPRPGE